MKKKTIMAAMMLTALAANAQETYEGAQLATEDLNGTARYVGMGGAMEALGADISTMGSNPAGIGLFRKSWAGVSAGVTFQKPQPTTNKDGVTNADVNQAGFVYATQVGSQSWFNLGINFHKSRNFNMVANAIGSMYDASSLNQLSVMRRASLMPDAKEWRDNYDSRWEEKSLQEQIEDYNYDTRWGELSLLDKLNYYTINDFLYTVNNGVRQEGFIGAEMYNGYNDNSGYIGEYDVNFSGNINDNFYLGVSLGLKDVHYKKETGYYESLIDAASQPIGDYLMGDYREITGTGFDIKFGVIFRPVEDSPFRIGAYIHTPTWYDLTCSLSTAVAAQYKYNNQEYDEEAGYGYEYKYKITTPWKFGLSFGHTINNMIAIGATYEYADYSFIKNKIVFDNDHSIYEPDYDMDANTKDCLRGVSTAKVGVEVKPVPEVAIRMGYNYVSPMYNDYASKDINVSPNASYGSNGSYFSTYDFINWKDTHRVTFGLGFALSTKMNLDLAYQFSTQKGDYHPFQSIDNMPMYQVDKDGNATKLGGLSCSGETAKVKNNRHQVNVTLGYRF